MSGYSNSELARAASAHISYLRALAVEVANGGTVPIAARALVASMIRERAASVEKIERQRIEAREARRSA